MKLFRFSSVELQYILPDRVHFAEGVSQSCDFDPWYEDSCLPFDLIAQWVSNVFGTCAFPERTHAMTLDGTQCDGDDNMEVSLDANPAMASTMSVSARTARWSRFAFDPQLMSSDIELDFPVPQHVSPAELQMLPIYMTLWQDYSPGSGVALDIPEWAETFLSSWNWTWAAVQCFVAAVSEADADLQDALAPLVPSESLDERQLGEREDPVAATVLRSSRPAKYGRCECCGSSRQPWVFKSGRNAGMAAFVCVEDCLLEMLPAVLSSN